ncbi:hypothetical protein Daura_17820 [Dactylosporangium aurantiacum]|uniref:Uncharacterized protein n=1 Tax=Dactylosporangium aurantiacum TaxID=35754 RepID=A0A9Q9IR26_9ACTN|nr:hypothetical protein [Dactylosporangium aurantiacum]MDG6109879.1 hypothetical protein [Dactylosporangium aurantiacum]UWZ57859.1 hypothetical protein Daura_17820 [Dactylosporangium aurantiacum]
MVAIHYTGAAARVGAVSRSLTQATFAALNAPSVLDTRPWRWRIGADRVELHADWQRRLADLDPDGRLLLTGCGAALHHARIALAAEGVGVDVRRFPDPGDPHLLTELRYTGPVRPAPRVVALHRAIAVRRSDRRPFAGTTPPGEDLTQLERAAEEAGAGAYTLRGHDGAYVVITAPGGDRPGDWLAVGEAVSAVLLTATSAGLATAPVSDLAPLAARPVPGAGTPAAAVRVGVAGRVGAAPRAAHVPAVPAPAG